MGRVMLPPPSPASHQDSVSPLTSQESLKPSLISDSQEKDGTAYVVVEEQRQRALRRHSIQRPSPQFCYKPTALKLWYLASLIGLLVTLIGMVEYSLRRLPDYTESNGTAELFNHTKAKREDDEPRGETHGVVDSSPTTADPTPVLVTPSSSVVSLSTSTPTPPTSTSGPASRSTASLSSAPLFSDSTVTHTMYMTAPSSYLNLGQSTIQLSTSSPTWTSGTSGGSTSLCLGCTVNPVLTAISAGSGVGYLSIGTATSTIGSGPASTDTPPSTQVTTVQQTVTLPDRTTVAQVTTTDAAGRLVTAEATTILGGSVTVEQTALTLLPGQFLETTTGLITTILGGTVRTESTTFTGRDGHPTTSVFETTLSGTTATLTTTFRTVGGTVASSTSGAPALGDNASAEGFRGDTIVIGLSYTSYAIGAFFPTLIAVVVTLPLKLINVNAKLFQPFHALTSTVGGATPEASVFLRFYGWHGLLSLPRALRLRQPVVVASEALVFGAALLAPIASEAVAVHVDSGCTGDCLGTLGVAKISARVLQGILGTMTLVLLVLAVLLSSYTTGVRQNPWSIAGMAALGLDGEVRGLMSCVPRGLSRKVVDDEVKMVFTGKRYALDQGGAIMGHSKGYGLVIRHPGGEDDRGALLRAYYRRRTASSLEVERAGKKRIMSFALLTWWGRALLISALSCVLVILVYYENTSGDTGFERFMDSQNFGVRFFFTALGVVLGFCMANFFRCVAVLSPYLQMSRRPMPADRSILLSPATNPFYGLYSAFRQRHFYLGLLAFTAILADFLPVTLAHVPFSLIETFETQVVCAWLSIAILGLMILVVSSSFLIRWPHMPVDPRTIAGALFYVSDSWMLPDLEGLSAAGKRDRDHIIRGMGATYVFGYTTGMSGRERVGIDILDEELEEDSRNYVHR